jgi:hypothetical protein
LPRGEEAEPRGVDVYSIGSRDSSTVPLFGHRGLGGPARRAVFGTSVGHLEFF